MQLLVVFRFSLVCFASHFHVNESCVSCCVCFRTFLQVVIAYMCAMLNFEDHFWIEFTIDLIRCIHLFDAR